MGNSLNSLSLLYQKQGNYAAAEPLYKRALAIVEKALGPAHPHVMTLLESMAAFYKETGRADEAKRLEDPRCGGSWRGNGEDERDERKSRGASRSN